MVNERGINSSMDQDTLQRILALSSRMAATRALNPLLGYAMDEALKLVGAEWGYLVLVRPDGTLDFRVTRGPNSSSPEQAQDQISMTILKKVLNSGEPLIVRDATADPNWAQSKSVSELKLRSVMCVPLVVQGDVIGAIYVENRRISGRFKEGNQIPLA